MHIDLFGPTQTESIGEKKYTLVCVDDYSRFTWIDFLRSTSNTFSAFSKICLSIQTEKGTIFKRLRSDHGNEFENSFFSEFCEGYVSNMNSLHQ